MGPVPAEPNTWKAWWKSKIPWQGGDQGTDLDMLASGSKNWFKEYNLAFDNEEEVVQEVEMQ